MSKHSSEALETSVFIGISDCKVRFLALETRNSYYSVLDMLLFL